MKITTRLIKLLPFTGFLFYCLQLKAQTVVIEETLRWNDEKNDSVYKAPFQPATHFLKEHGEKGELYFYQRRIETGFKTGQIQVNIIEREPINPEALVTENIASLNGNVEPEWNVKFEKGIPVTYVRLNTYFTESGQMFRITKFSLNLIPDRSSDSPSRLKKKSYAPESVLKEGDFYKIRIGSDGIYRIGSAFIRNMGLDPSSILLNQVQLYGNGGGVLPEIIGQPRIDDLAECAIQMFDQNGNNRWDNEDYLLFYGKGPHAWTFDASSGRYNRELNPYDDFAYYFLRFGSKNGKRIGELPSGEGQSFDQEINRYDLIIAREQDERSLTKSGLIWTGDEFSTETVKEFEHSLPGYRAGDTFFLTTNLLARSLENSNMLIFADNTLIHNQFFFRVNGEYTSDFSTPPLIHTSTIIPTGNTLRLRFQYNKPLSSSIAWIDRYILQGKTGLEKSGSQMRFSSSESMSYNKVRFALSGSFQEIWDVSDPVNPLRQNTWNQGNTNFFISQSGGNLKWYFAWDGSSFLQPEFAEKVANQNLHGINQADYLIITHPDFMEQATRLARFHSEKRNLKSEIVYPEQIYNEFSSGAQDISAIRDFIKMVYDRSARSGNPLDYVLMFGDASYDYKNRVNGNTNFVPVYQSINSHNPVVTHCSDDFFAILDDMEGYWSTGAAEGIDIGIGRLPVKNIFEAKTVVDKIERYDIEASRGDWRNRIVFVADDEDGNRFVNDCEDIAAIVNSDHPAYNVQKIYLDAYPQVSFGSGDKYPLVNQAIDDALDRGLLVFNYIGHGGGQGLAQERIITREQIQSWTNSVRMPLFVTATCELSRFDDPSQDSPGELILLNPNGGAIALVTTTRVVYTDINKDLNVSLFNKNLLEMRGERYPSLGEVYMRTKNNSTRSINQRNFILLGDPALVLAYPRETIIATTLNGKTLGSGSDTLKALSKVRIGGAVVDDKGQVIRDFNGVVSPTVFDKMLSYETLAQDRTSNRQLYQMQISALFRGNATVTNGEFEFSFVVPKDISYNYGNGKLSFYGNNTETDGHGYNTQIIVGGSSDSALIDQNGPEVSLYINDESWVHGAITGSTPLLLAKVRDENGINMVGNGIGRDLSAILDKGSPEEQVIVLNEFYQSKLDSYQEGEIRYRFGRLNPGKHTLELKVWDVYNNSSIATTEFEVLETSTPEIRNLLNYPNPFNTSTEFHFDHNQAGKDITVHLKIMNISGRVVYSATEQVQWGSTHYNGMAWDGRDQFGAPLARGVYIYQITLINADGDKSQAMQKLFLMR